MQTLLETAKVDDKRRVTFPADLPAGSRVTIQVIDVDCYIVRRLKEEEFRLVPVPIVDRLPDDPEWERVERAFSSARRTPAPFEE